MKNVSEMIQALKEIGNEWHKNDMHRFYIDISKANEVYRNLENKKWGQLPLNRYERANGKIWIEMETGEIKTKGISDSEETIVCIRELIG